MESAELFGMRQFLASCEHYVVQDTSKRFNNALDHVANRSPKRMRTADCIHRMCHLRDHPVQTWSPAKFLRENLNYYKPGDRYKINLVDSGATIR